MSKERGADLFYTKNKGKNEEEQEEVVSVSEGSETVENNEEIIEDIQADIVEEVEDEVEEDFVESEPIEEDFTFEESTDDSLANDTTDAEYQELRAKKAAELGSKTY